MNKSKEEWETGRKKGKGDWERIKDRGGETDGGTQNDSDRYRGWEGQCKRQNTRNNLNERNMKNNKKKKRNVMWGIKLNPSFPTKWFSDRIH